MERFVGRYALLRSLGSGGMGTVHLALDLSTMTQCALKRLHPDAVSVEPDSLRHEFELLTRVRHPAVVAVHELGFAPDGSPYYTMEYVPGLSAGEALRAGDWPALCFVAAEVARALEALHGAGVLHGDLKPTNVLVIPGQGAGALPAGVRVVDFGLGAWLDAERQGHRGTPGFAAPEVVRGEEPDVASDLYGLGATLYALVSGRAAFSPATSPSALRRQQGAAPPAVPLEEAGAPAALVQLILRLLAPARDERPRDAREVRAELERIAPAARRTLALRLETERVVGRERELGRLERWLARPGEGASVMLVTGAPGVGKSALLAELAVRASLARRAVFRLSGAAPAHAGPAALALWRQFSAEAGAEGGRTEPAARALALIERTGPLADDEISTLAGALVAWAGVLHRRGTPPVILIDDREGLDPLSHRLLRRAAFHPDAHPLRWAWAGRADAGLGTHDRILLESGQLELLALPSLERADADRMVAVRLHGEPPALLADALWRRAGGHPGLVVEMLRAAAEHGALRETEVGLTADAAALESLALPADFEASRLARLAALPPAARALASALAVRGRPTTLVQARELAPAAGEAGLESLLASGLATRDPDGRCTLDPPGLGARVLESLAPRERTALHAAALAVPGADALPPAERFAHLRGAGNVAGALAAAREGATGPDALGLVLEAAALAEREAPGEAAAWLERAGSALHEHGRYRDAVPLLERALALAPAGAERFARWRLLSTACLRAGRPEDVERVVAMALAEGPPPREQALLLANEASRLATLGELDRATEVASRALALAAPTGDGEAEGMAALTLGSLQFSCGRTAEAAALGRRAEDACARAGHALGRARAIGLRATIATAQDPALAETLYLEALAIARRDGLRLATEELLMSLAVLHMTLGRWNDSAEGFAEALRIALEDGRPRGAAIATANLAMLDGFCGRVARASRRARAGVRLTRAYAPRFEAFAWRALAQARRIAGRRRRAARAVRRALSHSMRPGMAVEREWSRIEYARLCAASGRWKEAGEVAERSLARDGAVGSIGQAVLAVIAGRAALRRRDFAVTDARLAACAQWLDAHTAPYARAHLLQLRAERALAVDRFEEGTALAREALAAYSALPAPPDRAAAALDLARLAMNAGGGVLAPVSEWLQDAAGAFERLGDHPNRERALAYTVEWLERTRGAGPGASVERDLLKSVARLLDSLSDLRELTERAMEMAVEYLDAERGVLLLTDGKGGGLLPVVEHGAVDADTRDRALSYSRRVVERVARSGGSLLIGDAPTDPNALSASVVGLRLRSIVCVPLYVGGHVYGAVYLDDSRRPDTFTDADRGLLEGFAHLMALAIEKSLGHEETRRANEALVGENLSLRREVGASFQPVNCVGTSVAMQKVLAMVERAAETDATVLITGENGTGKELIARILHHGGRRRLEPFVSVNCGAIPEQLLESELFGILANVATGVHARKGRFEAADGGTLFLDEIGDMPLQQQVALLAAIASR